MKSMDSYGHLLQFHMPNNHHCEIKFLLNIIDKYKLFKCAECLQS